MFFNGGVFCVLEGLGELAMETGMWRTIFFTVIAAVLIGQFVRWNGREQCTIVRSYWIGVERSLRTMRHLAISVSKSSSSENDRYNQMTESVGSLREKADALQRSVGATLRPSTCLRKIDERVEFSFMSRAGTDGVLYFIFAAIGTRSRIVRKDLLPPLLRPFVVDKNSARSTSSAHEENVLPTRRWRWILVQDEG